MPRILYFGRLREAAGGAEEMIDLPADVQTGADLIAYLTARDAALGAALAAPSVRIAVDKALGAADEPITGAAEIAFMPPMSGG